MARALTVKQKAATDVAGTLEIQGVAGWAPVGVVLWMSLVRPVEGASGVCDTIVL